MDKTTGTVMMSTVTKLRRAGSRTMATETGAEIGDVAREFVGGRYGAESQTRGAEVWNRVDKTAQGSMKLA
jgi:hypothetical protein